jgi:hypothetical protein
MEAPPQDEFRRYLILSVLRANRGPMLMSQICAEVHLLRERMNNPLSDRELKLMGHAKKLPKWTIEIRQACRRMVVDKRVRRTRSPFGWEITWRGLEWLDEASASLLLSHGFEANRGMNGHGDGSR